MPQEIGLNSLQTTSDREYMVSRVWVLIQTITIDSSARDSGNSPTTQFRKGRAVGRVTATGRWMQYDNTGGDGRETARAVLDEPVDMLDDNGVATNKDAIAAVAGYIDSDLVYVIGSDAAVTTLTSEAGTSGITDLTTGANGCFFIVKQY